MSHDLDKIYGKGSRRRPESSVVDKEEIDLRWELVDAKTTLKRKAKIKKRLEEIRNEKLKQKVDKDLRE